MTLQRHEQFGPEYISELHLEYIDRKVPSYMQSGTVLKTRVLMYLIFQMVFISRTLLLPLPLQLLSSYSTLSCLPCPLLQTDYLISASPDTYCFFASAVP